MNSKDIMKWLLIAGAAYLVYRYLQTNGMLGGTKTAVQPAAGAPASLPGATATPAAAGPNATTITQSLAAAAKTAGYDPTALYNGYQWAYFWERSSLYNGTPIGPTEMGIGDTDTVPIGKAVAAISKLLAGVQGLGVLQNLMANAPKMLSAWAM